jgi:hypothetical protein
LPAGSKVAAGFVDDYYKVRAGRLRRVSVTKGNFYKSRFSLEFCGNSVHKGVSTIKHCARFATIAVNKGYITAEQAKAALLEQIEADIANQRHRLLGSILFEKGWMTVGQIDMVLDELFHRAS